MQSSLLRNAIFYDNVSKDVRLLWFRELFEVSNPSHQTTPNIPEEIREKLIPEDKHRILKFDPMYKRIKVAAGTQTWRLYPVTVTNTYK